MTLIDAEKVLQSRVRALKSPKFRKMTRRQQRDECDETAILARLLHSARAGNAKSIQTLEKLHTEGLA